MNISVNVMLDADDNFAYTPDAGAQQVLAALGGNPTSDYCTLSVQQAASGVAGTPPGAAAQGNGQTTTGGGLGGEAAEAG